MLEVNQSATASSGAVSAPPGRLLFLDGIRGAAALYVLMFHVLNMSDVKPTDYSRPLQIFRSLFDHGHLSVVVFIVLSGFSLMLPLARKGVRSLPDFGNFALRRARRILPPYYASLVFGAACLLAYKVYVERRGGSAPEVAEALSLPSISTHALLIHNWWFDLAFRINAPAWSVATEWQIYFGFALLLLPLARHWGTPIAVVVAWVVGAMPFYVLPDGKNFFWACPWFLGSFAFGMWGAEAACAARQGAKGILRIPWEMLALLGVVAVIAVEGFRVLGAWSIVQTDFFVSVVGLLVLMACSVAELPRSQLAKMVGGAFRRVFESRVLVEAGAFSYSFYLIHHPILRLSEKVIGRLPLGTDLRWLAHLLVGGGASLALGWLFSEFFERPFTGGGVVLPWLKERFRSATPEPG